MQFSFDKFTPAKCTHVNKRTENHGDTEVHAKDLNWKVTGPNTMLDLIHPSLRKSLYKHAGTKILPGFEDVTPELICPLFEGPFAIKFEGSGYMLTVRFGEVSGDQIELSGVEVAKAKTDAHDGGTVDLFFRTSHVGLSMAEMGRLDTFDGKELSILLAAPAQQTGTPPKKKKEAKDDKTKPLPLTGGGPFKHTVVPGKGIVDNNPTAGQEKDATEAFLDQAAKEDAAKAADPKAAREAERAKRFPSEAKRAAAKKKPAAKKAPAKKAARRR